MTQSRKLSSILIITVRLLTPGPSAVAAGDGGKPIHFVKGGKADTDAKLNYVFKTGPKGTTTPADANGNVVIPQNILSSAKPHKTRMRMYQCPDGTFIAVEEGVPEDQIKCPEGKPKPLGGYWTWGDGATVDEDAGTVTSTGVAGGGLGAATHPEKHLVSFQVDGGLGFMNFVNANTCHSILDVLPNASCKAGDKSFAFGVGGTVKFTPYFGFRVGYMRANAITRNFTSSLPGDIKATDTFQPSYLLAMPGLFLPVGRFNFFADGGLAYHGIHLFERQSVGGGAPTTTSLHDSGAGPGFGGGLELSLKKNFGFRFEYKYLAARKSDSFSEHSHVATFGAYLGFR